MLNASKCGLRLIISPRKSCNFGVTSISGQLQQHFNDIQTFPMIQRNCGLNPRHLVKSRSCLMFGQIQIVRSLNPHSDSKSSYFFADQNAWNITKSSKKSQWNPSHVLVQLSPHFAPCQLQCFLCVGQGATQDALRQIGLPERWNDVGPV